MPKPLDPNGLEGAFAEALFAALRGPSLRLRCRF